MLNRVDSFFDFFALDDSDRLLGQRLASEAAARANGMTQQKDYEALAAVCLYRKPQHIFEIGTYLGVTSDFFLQLLPECRVVSIAYVNRKWNILRKKLNNSGLSKKQIGSHVHQSRRSRFTQLIGDSHELRANDLLENYGPFDLVLIDGDHSYEGVLQDTELVREIIGEGGVICWHDANPREKYMDVRLFLEKEPSFHAIATRDDYEGGIACWNEIIQNGMIT
ncbi:class I SAM-dependent methyltransferase [Planctomycetota bacterium]